MACDQLANQCNVIICARPTDDGRRFSRSRKQLRARAGNLALFVGSGGHYNVAFLVPGALPRSSLAPPLMSGRPLPVVHKLLPAGVWEGERLGLRTLCAGLPRPPPLMTMQAMPRAKDMAD
ncbi:hypothetical protein NDU88_001934 [Pleurodeles waltl]|uniref:Uncharacterized protein n=1 Tax=Pleurodeles waltl TaxID=8319 RepID=A0AAV7Q5Q5_PLEWA|nr:hypothetical protein NDU88_001934 [Pleurodeles waltl]